VGLEWMCAWVGQSQDGEAPDESQEVHENAFLEVADLEAQYTGLADQESEVDDSKEELEVQGILPPEVEDAAEPAKKKKLVNIYPFCNPRAYYVRLFERLTNIGCGMSHLILLTRSAHPSHLIAARDVGLEVIALVGASDHSFAHGQDLLEKLLTMRAMPRAKKLVAPSTAGKRVRGQGMNFIAAGVAQCAEQVPMCDAAPDPSSGWRGGFDLNPTDMESRLIKQTQKELDDNGLYLKTQADGRLGRALLLNIFRK
jgi:hypothetical protein